jgi:ferredoxin
VSREARNAGRDGSGYGSYYGKPVIKAPVWEPVIPVYFFFGGTAGAAAGLGLAGRLTGNAALARTATYVNAVAIGVSPALLIIDRRERDQLPTVAHTEVSGLGTTHKCTLCYDRLKDDMEPACAQACPTKSIQFGPLDQLRERAQQRVGRLHDEGVAEARLYGESADDGVGGMGAFFLLLDEPEVYGLPPDPVVPTRHLRTIWASAFVAGAALLAATAVSVLGSRA